MIIFVKLRRWKLLWLICQSQLAEQRVLQRVHQTALLQETLKWKLQVNAQIQEVVHQKVLQLQEAKLQQPKTANSSTQKNGGKCSHFFC